jgi:hypothetical protein
MKTILIMLFVAITTCVNANVLTVSNVASSPAQYPTITDAVTAAVNGDTILVHGSPIGYDAMGINKQLFIFGTGHHPNKQQPFKTTSAGVTFFAGADGSVVDGFCFNGLSAYQAINNVTVRHCEFYHTITLGFSGPVMNNWLFENNIFWGGNFNPFFGEFYNNVSLVNFIFRNNIIYNRISGLLSNVIFDHNLFYAGNSATAFTNVNNGTFTNNIFYMMSPQSAANATFINNLTYNTSDDVIPYGSNSGSGNLIGVDPAFVNFPPAGATYDIGHDYHLQSSSTAAGAGSDGTDLGPEGGITGGFSMSGEPHIPVIRVFNILNSTVPVGGQLNISVTATKAEDE